MRNRRSVLKISSALIATASGIGTVSGSSKDFDAIYSEALDIKRSTEGVKDFHAFLQENEFNTYHRHEEKTFDADDSEDGYSSQQLDLTVMDGDITLSQSCNAEYTWVDFTWRHDVRSGYDFAQAPVDIVGMYWSSTDYNRITDTSYAGSHVCSPEVDGTCGDLHPNGIAFEYNDSLDQGGSSTDYIGSDAGLKVKKYDMDDDPEDRIILIEYAHLYNQGTVESIGISTGGLSLTLGVDTRRENKDFQADETEMVPDCGGVT